MLYSSVYYHTKIIQNSEIGNEKEDTQVLKQLSRPNKYAYHLGRRGADTPPGSPPPQHTTSLHQTPLHHNLPETERRL